MAFAGGVGADVTGLNVVDGVSDAALLFGESTTRFVVEVRPERAAEFEACLGDVPFVRLGKTVREPRLRIADRNGEWAVWAPLEQLKEAWQKPLRW